MPAGATLPDFKPNAEAGKSVADCISLYRCDSQILAGEVFVPKTN